MTCKYGNDEDLSLRKCVSICGNSVNKYIDTLNRGSPRRLQRLVMTMICHYCADYINSLTGLVKMLYLRVKYNYSVKGSKEIWGNYLEKAVNLTMRSVS